MVVVGCGDSGGGDASGGGGGEAAGFAISQRVPLDLEADVALDAQVTARFNAPLDTTTVDDTSFVLEGANGTMVNGTVTASAAEDTATFVPADTLALLAPYTASLAESILDLDGRMLTGERSWRFTTLDGAWGEAGLIERDAESRVSAGGLGIDVAIAPDGTAFAVFGQEDFSGNWDIRANRFEPGETWGTAALVENESTRCRFPHVAVDATGAATVVFEHFDGMRTNIRFNRYSEQNRWGVSGLLETSDDIAFGSDIAVDAQGVVIAVWGQGAADDFNIWANRFTKEGGWSGRQQVEPSGNGVASEPQITMTPDGVAFVVWRVSSSGPDTLGLRSSRFNPDTMEWGTDRPVSAQTLSAIRSFAITADVNGNAIAVWVQADDSGDRVDVWANRYVSGDSWGDPEPIETEVAGDAGFPDVAADPAGNAIAVWNESDGIRSNIWTNRYSSGDSWGRAIRLETDNRGSAFSSRVATDAAGNAMAIWEQSDGTTLNVWYSRYTAGSNWSPRERLEVSDDDARFLPAVALSPRGFGIAGWQEYDGTRMNMWANTFNAP